MSSVLNLFPMFDIIYTCTEFHRFLLLIRTLFLCYGTIKKQVVCLVAVFPKSVGPTDLTGIKAVGPENASIYHWTACPVWKCYENLVF